MNERYSNELIQSLSFQDDQGILGFLGQFNEWYPMPEKWINGQALCSGIETREPLFWFDAHRFVATFEVNRKQFGADDLCDDFGMRAQIDPRNLYFENDPERQKKVERRLAEYEDPLTLLNDQGYYYMAKRIEDTRFPDHFWMGRVMPVTMYWYFSSWAYMKEWCKEHHPNLKGSPLFYDHCALAHVNEKANPMWVPQITWWNLDDFNWSRKFREYEFKLADCLLYLGVILNLTGVLIPRNVMVIFVFWMNLGIASMYTFDYTHRYGIDYIAYLQQASAVFKGETDYTKLSSNLGPCFYPAGHLYHYIAAYWLHTQTEDAEYIIKFGHLVIHSLVIYFVVKISYSYFAEEKYKTIKGGLKDKFEKYYDETRSSKAQMIGFILLAGKEDRYYWSTMYNDEIMMLYMLVAIYLAIKNKPLASACLFTVALGVKAGVILLLPALLGQIQYNHGTVKLFLALLIIVGFQVVTALPFVLGDSTLADYIQRSKLTGAGRNGIAKAALFWDYMAAHIDLSIFWTFIDQDCYFHYPCLAFKLRIAMLSLNVYHFFVRKWCFPRCFENLLKTFDSKASEQLGIREHEQLRLTAEILILGYMGGIVTMPGANQQFQFWFMPIVPVVIEMVGLPSVLTCWIYGYFWPVMYDDPQYQHYFLLGLVAWLYTVGPVRSYYQSALQILGIQGESKKIKGE